MRKKRSLICVRRWKNRELSKNRLIAMLEELFLKSEFVERFLELSLFYGLSSPLNSEMICIFPYF